MIDIVDRLSFDATRCELQFSKGVASNIEEAAAEIKRLRAAVEAALDRLVPVCTKIPSGVIATLAGALNAEPGVPASHPRGESEPVVTQACPGSALRITDDILHAAVKAMIPERIVGFSTPLNESRTKWGAPHYVEDVRLRKELWRGDDAEELRVRCEMERMRLALNAALGGGNA